MELWLPFQFIEMINHGFKQCLRFVQLNLLEGSAGEEISDAGTHSFGPCKAHAGFSQRRGMPFSREGRCIVEK